MNHTSILVCLVCAAFCHERTITVDDDGPADFNNIQAAIDDANDGDVVVVQPGAYERVDFKGKNIVVRSCDPTDWSIVHATHINAQSSGDWAVKFRGTEDRNCMLSGFTIGGSVIGYDSEANSGNENHTEAVISHCDISRNQTPTGNILSAFDGAVSNCRITENRGRPHHLFAPLITGGKLFENCTIANNSMDISIGEGASTFVNCIIYSTSAYPTRIGRSQDAQLKLMYCNLQTLDEWPSDDPNAVIGPGNTDSNPCFVDPTNGDYHLKSRAGRWDPNSNSCVRDDVTSPCIDAGDPMTPIGDEPFPNGGIINMGAYGGTAEASKSWFDKPICETIVAGDLNGGCTVNLKDYIILASHWLEGH